jgi:K+-sensing histidine kinase KdpD
VKVDSISSGTVSINNASSVLVTDNADVLVVSDASRDPMPPNAYAIGIAFTATLVLAAVLGEAGHWASGGLGLALMAAAVGVSAWWCRPLTSVIAGALGWLMFNGFVVDQSGTLGWHGTSDTLRLGVLLAVAVSVALARAVTVAMTRRVVLEELSLSPVSHRIPQQQGGSHA